MHRIYYTALVAFILAGCAGSPAHILSLNKEELKSVKTPDLCNTYDLSPSPDVKEEISSRNIISKDEWELIAFDEIKVGMSEMALICSWGRPGRVNRTTTKNGVSKQYVYRYCSYCTTNYVYVEDGKVIGIQN